MTGIEASAAVAVVAGRPVPLDRLERRIAELRRGPLGRQIPPAGRAEPADLRRLVARQLVTEEILAHEAIGVGLPERDFAGVVARLLERVTADVTVTEGDVRGYYERNVDRFRVPEARRVRHVLVADEATARQLVDRLHAGADLATLAMGISTDAGSRPGGGDLGAIRRGELAGDLEEALFGAAIGEIVGPVRSEHGWHVARVEARQPARVEPFEAVRDAIEAELLAAAREKAFADWLEVRRAALAVMEPDFAHPADPDHGIPSHRH